MVDGASGSDNRAKCILQALAVAGLFADLDAGPGRMLRDMSARVEPQPGIVRHLARNEDKVVADDRRHKAGGWCRGNA